ncbi:MAG TPA: cell division protein SepF [Actinomycetota bacterium]|nr:cell division protein SepF [Actinomycetota bacterium]
MSSIGVWKKTLVLLGLAEDEDLDDELDLIDETPAENPPSIRKITREEMSKVHPLPSAQPLGQVHIVAPTSYDDAKEIGDKLRSSVPVIMNLQSVEEDLFKRLTAFASGLAYGLNGEVQRLAPRMYLVTPANVEVSAEDRQRLKRGLFNEF